VEDKRAIIAGLAERGRISSIVSNGSKKMATKADLAFVDAAIQLTRAGMASVAGGPSVDASSPIACDPVDVAAAVVAVAVLAYHVYNSCMIGEDSAILNLASRLNVAPNVSLEGLIAARNQLAGALGVAER
jgi:hypothetical protein